MRRCYSARAVEAAGIICVIVLMVFPVEAQDGPPLGDINFDADSATLSSDIGDGGGIPGDNSPGTQGGDVGGPGGNDTSTDTSPGGGAPGSEASNPGSSADNTSDSGDAGSVAEPGGGVGDDANAGPDTGPAENPPQNTVSDAPVIVEVQNTIYISEADLAAIDPPPPAPDDGKEYVLLLLLDGDGKPTGYQWAPLAVDDGGDGSDGDGSNDDGSGVSPTVITTVAQIGPAPNEPCTPYIDSTNFGMQFDCPGDAVNGLHWGWAINVWARIPPHIVDREPFPRGLVALPNYFTLRTDAPRFSVEGGPNGPGGAGGFWSNTAGSREYPVGGDEFKIGSIANYRLGLRWVRVDTQCAFGPVEATCWSFGDRAWNLGRDFGYGIVTNGYCGSPFERVTHTYETSSYDLPANGPRVDLVARVVPSWDLQAYQVTVPTFWQGEWAAEWEVAEETPCPGDQETGERDGAPVCIRWVERKVDWRAIDLRRYNYPTPYYKSYKVVECGQYAGREWCQESRDGSVPTPIIESQPIIITYAQ